MRGVTEVRDASGPISLTSVYHVAVNNFIATGGDNFSVLTGGKNQVGGPADLDALVTYIEGLPQPFSATIAGRITRH